MSGNEIQRGAAAVLFSIGGIPLAFFLEPLLPLGSLVWLWVTLLIWIPAAYLVRDIWGAALGFAKNTAPLFDHLSRPLPSKRGLLTPSRVYTILWAAFIVHTAIAWMTVEQQHDKGESQPPRLTLYSLYLDDFQGPERLGLGFSEKNNLTRHPTGIRIPYEYRIIYDSAALAKYIAFYLKTDSDLVGVCAAIADRYMDLAPPLMSLGVDSKSGGDVDFIRSKNVKFNGRIYIYHEATLTLQEKAALDTLYESRSLVLTLRGMDYLVAQTLVEREITAPAAVKTDR